MVSEIRERYCLKLYRRGIFTFSICHKPKVINSVSGNVIHPIHNNSVSNLKFKRRKVDPDRSGFDTSEIWILALQKNQIGFFFSYFILAFLRFKNK